eukprot:3322760-Pyramimonas_sp.AAC.1
MLQSRASRQIASCYCCPHRFLGAPGHVFGCPRAGNSNRHAQRSSGVMLLETLSCCRVIFFAS